jgi:steroid delta-isomerase-like uncharacterized protein
MESKSNEARMNARLQLVEEHLRLENLHDLDGILGTFGSDARYDDEPWNDHRIGREQVYLYYKELLAAAADFRIEVRNRYATDEAVILEAAISGTHTGGWRGLPATGKPVSFPLCGIFTFDLEDRILGEKIYYDRATVLRQLGLFREPTSIATDRNKSSLALLAARSLDTELASGLKSHAGLAEKSPKTNSQRSASGSGGG